MPREARRRKREVVDELKRLGRELHATARAAWESEERREFESEIVSGLDSLANEIEKALKDFAEGPHGQALRVRAREVKHKAQSGELSTEGRETLLKALRQVNAELERLQHSWTPAKKSRTKRHRPRTKETTP